MLHMYTYPTVNHGECQITKLDYFAVYTGLQEY